MIFLDLNSKVVTRPSKRIDRNTQNTQNRQDERNLLLLREQDGLQGEHSSYHNLPTTPELSQSQSCLTCTRNHTHTLNHNLHLIMPFCRSRPLFFPKSIAKIRKTLVKNSIRACNHRNGTKISSSRFRGFFFFFKRHET